ncbi:hypothetical protein QQS21_006945 [Conoideocrella luteorostrata]|uniref:Small nuclear ribonucleoprotein Prp3 C-terminal domain-containing protein n=1 Tax=Conoideocrella luteorostrata TaxID=1105319 RepID=A0AAJ0CM26_9HYPO|nr:hypothetical protein QQS21_006945 [Conoideocrella luteorostrata]
MTCSILPGKLIELQLAQIDLLMAMYPAEGAILFDDGSSTSLDALRLLHSGAIDLPPPNAALSVSLFLNLEVDADDGTPKETIQLHIIVPFTYDEENGHLDEAPHPKVRLVQPTWMSKAAAAALMDNVPKDEDLFAVIEHIKDATCSHRESLFNGSTAAGNIEEPGETLVRIWFYFPSISTRSKRDDIVKYAPTYNLTGFLLSGKPGILCLEGASSRVDAYMKFIKTESWSDIPAYHKKVSERYRENVAMRAFEDMQEITNTLGERRGERANRSDMKLLEAWLVERGLGEAFMKVLT